MPFGAIIYVVGVYPSKGKSLGTLSPLVRSAIANIKSFLINSLFGITVFFKCL